MSGQSDFNSTPRLSSVLLNGLNYVPWSRVTSIALGGKSLLGHIDGTKPAPKADVEKEKYTENMWDELGLHRPPTNDLVTLQKRAEQHKVFQLLANVKPEFENLRGNILMGSETPSLSSVCASIQQEETRKKTMNIDQKSPIINSEASALMVDKRKVLDNKKQGSNIDKEHNPLSNKRGRCDVCDTDRHSRDRCWVLYPHLKPKFKKGDRINKVANSVGYF
ncbi:hypothetical protein RHGRI_014036 [Rhododendron griersonianum]|uniref:Retrotransposon Copia-like N-terminal domain-containing protein n=1 Tax=Rhododendron griersonianum TaxID=479676 RepID=A0AAV6K7U2_9ERIC|nr:hypothetical protein RHGRI_014036 [Rhododendron griersonianum]